MYHPAVALIYFAAILVLSMAAIQPVYIAVSLVAGLSYSFFLSGWKRALTALVWQIPIIVVVALINPIFASMGSTELFRIGASVFYLESFIYGACFGAMLVSVLVWFTNVAKVIASDKVTSLLGGRVPTLALMISMGLRLVPQFLDQANEIKTIHEVNAPAQKRPAKGRLVASSASRRPQLSARVRQISVLMGWSMENSLDSADAMRARGWGATKERTTYQRHRFKARDGVAIATLLVLVLASAVLAVVAVDQFAFYPTISGFIPWYGYLPYGVLAFSPLIIQVAEGARWKR